MGVVNMMHQLLTATTGAGAIKLKRDELTFKSAHLLHTSTFHSYLHVSFSRGTST